MPLSNTSYEILSDLLELRLETFLVTSTEEAKELRMLRHCQKELEHLHQMGAALLPAPTPAKSAEMPATTPTMQTDQETVFTHSRLPRRLQRLIAKESRRAG